MYQNTLEKDTTETKITRIQPARSEVRAAQALLKQNRTQGLAALNTLFRSGSIPEPFLNGRYAGELLALDIAPGLTQFYGWLTSWWMPWLGKTFNSAQQSGDNIFMQDSYPLARFFNPFYRGFVADGPKTYRGFAFRTYLAAGLADPDRTVLKINYDLDDNPALTVRRVLDELVQLDEQFYLGKAHVHWWTGGWQLVAYFSLTGEAASTSV
jgi:hypothetical protein